MRIAESTSLRGNLRTISKTNRIGQRVANKVYDLQAALRQVNSFEEATVELEQLKVTNHGENRIRHCVKYDLGNGFRLVTIQHKGIIVLEFVGNHEDTDKWLSANVGKTLIAAKNSIVWINNGADEQQVYWIDSHESLPLNSHKPLLEYLKSRDLHFVEELDIPLRNYRQLMGIFSDSTKDELDASLDGVEVSISIFLRGLFQRLQDDDLDGAALLIDHEKGEYEALADLDSTEIENLALGQGYIELRDLTREEWNNLLSSDWEDWMLYLHPDQREVVEKDFSGPSRLLGVSGSGKTCVLVHRAVYLAKKYKEPILITTINNSLSELLKELVDQLINLEVQHREEIRKLIEVKSFWKFSFDFILGHEKDKLIKRGLEEYSDKSQDDVDRIWEEFISLEENNDDYSKAFDVVTSLKSRGMDAHTYIKDEFNLIRSATKFTRRDDYYEMSRKGRKTLLNKDQRAIVLEALSAWEEKMEHVGVSDYMNLLRFVNKHEDELRPKYRSILIDEIQDFGTEELRVLRKVVAENANDIFMCGDIAQQVQVKQHKIRTAGITVPPSNYLTIIKNYRNSREILRAANTMFNANIDRADFNEDGFELLDPEMANFHTTIPSVYYASSLEAELEYAINYLNWLVDVELISRTCIAVAGLSHFEVCRLSDQVKLPILNGESNLKGKPLVLSELNQTKGFEFDVVVVLNLNKETFPRPNYPKEEVFRDISRLYVAMTRAKKELILSYNTSLSDVFKSAGDTIREPDLWESQLDESIERVEIKEFTAPAYDNLIFSDLDGLSFVIRTPLIFSRELALKLRSLVSGRSASDTSGRPTQFKNTRDLAQALKISRYQGHMKVLFGAQYKELLEVFDISVDALRI